MKRPFDNEVPIRRMGLLLVLLIAAIAIVLAAVAALGRIWHVGNPPDWQTIDARRGIAPALETTPQSALRAYLAEKQRIAQDHVWINASRHLARIPVEEAMRALAETTDIPAEQRSAYLMGLETDDGNHK